LTCIERAYIANPITLLVGLGTVSVVMKERYHVKLEYILTVDRCGCGGIVKKVTSGYKRKTTLINNPPRVLRSDTRAAAEFKFCDDPIATNQLLRINVPSPPPPEIWSSSRNVVTTAKDAGDGEEGGNCCQKGEETG
jgi:hypothetical protein